MTQIVSALTIAGTDPTGGAGIQADLKTFQEREVYGMSVLTSAVAQNTQGVQAVHHLPIDFIERQLDAVFQDIKPHAIKTGMISTIEMMELIANYVSTDSIPYVIDPVMVSTSGDALMEESSRQVIRDVLVPKATVVTPNIPEAEILVGFTIQNIEDMKKAAKVIVEELGAASAVVKGGHLDGKAVDVFYDRQFHFLEADRVNTKHTHGTGCTFSAAITAELAKGKSTLEAVKMGKQFITAAIRYPLNIGKGNGPTNHWGYRLKELPNQGGNENESNNND
ncbi:Hydroxymethylpyrimidine/phosphomethylpyrimidine kinase [Paraliobacillus sp. PM-2]|uniref:bifunctional hydroxymethylpyrimidine kinase/phosphomethylpyrimidine kinase n=1 Tax=Paraliobacillus sp. PM-2 TaxID=1462524 RepID=UPI00061C3245|nr:bifunctional hydroxymethylpyrimidine kinase/phosphomethylpyrimidine kinase [Paraliobacillus sp. PM-2]CQR48341.1 Hydroxymethylpyrimidine/phosphomethylpyrimidine kinase [Paraliobacillus sp. PM-2]